MRKSLYLDDVRTPTSTLDGYGPWQVVRSYDEFVHWIQTNGIPDMISFDQDLADERHVCGEAKEGSHQPLICKRKVPLCCNDQMIQHPDVQQLTTFYNLMGQFQISL